MHSSYTFLGKQFHIKNNLFMTSEIRDGINFMRYQYGGVCKTYSNDFECVGNFNDIANWDKIRFFDNFVYYIVQSIKKLYYDMLNPPKYAYIADKQDLYYDGDQCYYIK